MSDPEGEQARPGSTSRHAALQGSVLAQWLTPTTQSRIEHIDCADIDDRTWPSGTGSNDALVALRRSVSQRGVIEPLLLRPVADGRLEVVLGSRRLRVARELGLASLPAIVRELTDSEAALLAVWSILPRLSDHGMGAVAAHLSGAGVADGEIALLLATAHPGVAEEPRRQRTRTFASSTPLRFATLRTPVSRLVDALGPARTTALAALNRTDPHRLDMLAS